MADNVDKDKNMKKKNDLTEKKIIDYLAKATTIYGKQFPEVFKDKSQKFHYYFDEILEIAKMIQIEENYHEIQK